MEKNSKLKTVYVLNPISGCSKARKVFEQIKDIAYKDDIIWETKQKDQAFYVFSNIYLGDIENIVGIGGDGTIKEIIEGLKKNSSIKNNIILNNISIGHIPAGTGNGLAASIMYLNNMPYNIANSILPIKNIKKNKKKIKKIDVAQIQTLKGTFHSFLAISIGFISDLDINTEMFRWLGSFRYYLGAIIGLYFMQSYNVSLYYLPETLKQDKPLNLNDEIPNTWNSIHGDFIMIWACNLSHPSYDVFISPDIKFDDGLHHIVLLKNDISRIEMLWLLLNLENGNILQHPKVTYIKTKEYRIKVNDVNATITIDGEKIDVMKLHININNKNMNILV
jgi:sphingosine kinase